MAYLTIVLNADAIAELAMFFMWVWLVVKTGLISPGAAVLFCHFFTSLYSKEFLDLDLQKAIWPES